MSDGSNGNGHAHVKTVYCTSCGSQTVADLDVCQHCHKRLVTDLGADRDEREPKPCCARLENGGWCTKPDGHNRVRLADGRTQVIDDPCTGPARQLGPLQSQWHVHRGQKKICGQVTGPATLCRYERGHGGKHEEP